MPTHHLESRFDAILWDRTLTGDPLPLAELVAAPDGTRSEHIVVETVIVEDTNPLETLTPTKHATELHTAGAVTVMKVDHPDGAFTISAWPTQHEGVFHGSTAHSNWFFVEGSGTDQLINLHGTGSYDSVDQQRVNSSFIYSFGEV